MVSEKVIITTESGLHFRPADRLSVEALRYECAVHFKVGDTVGSLKSFLGILAAGIKQNSEVEIICDGVDEEEALHNIVELIRNGL
jgi:phosphocarrier protein